MPIHNNDNDNDNDNNNNNGLITVYPHSGSSPAIKLLCKLSYQKHIYKEI